MDLGISTYSFPWAFGVPGFETTQPFTASDLISFAAQKNIRVVQLGDNYPMQDFSREQLQGLKKLADQWNVQIEVGTKRLTNSNIINYLAIARTMECSFIRVIIDDLDYHPSQTEIIEIIRSLLPQLELSKVRLAIENHDRLSVQTLKLIVENTDPELIGICLDTANSFGAGESIREVVTCLAPYTINVHIKDFIIKRVHHKMGFRIEGCIAGTGMLNIPWLLNTLDAQRCCTATLEVWSDMENTITDTIKREKEWVEKSIDYLKTIIT